MRRAVLALLAVLLLLVFTGCSKTCKVKGCDNEVHEDGYCTYHYVRNGLEEAANTAGDFLGDLFG